MIKIGSIERPFGEVWDHRGKTQLVQIFISYTDNYINFLQFLYVEDGNLVLSERPARAKQGSKFNTVKLNYPDEFLTSITGSYDCSYGAYVISSITFSTNRHSHGPFGQPGNYDSKFDFQMGQDQPFGGFHGSTNKNGDLESIGVYVKPIATLSNLAGEVKKRESRLAYV